MNWIEREVLVKFLFTDTAELKQLRPNNVDSNLFSYHLNLLITGGLVLKQARNNYQLTPLGKYTAGLISKDSGKLTRMPKIAVMIYARNKASEYLLYEWKRQPYLGQVSLPYGKLHFDDEPQAAARNELKEKTGLFGNLKHKKDFYYRVFDGRQTLTHMLVHTYEASKLEGKLSSNVSGHPFWAKLEPNLDYVPGFRQVVEHIESSSNDLVSIDAKL